MAHIGSFVPAQRAVVGLTDRILTRIITQDQLAARQSSFMADLLQVGGFGLVWEASRAHHGSQQEQLWWVTVVAVGYPR
jgi:hypothetical protein